MNLKHLALLSIFFLSSIVNSQAQTASDTVKVKKYQAKPPKTQPFGAEAFQKTKGTTLRWTGMAGFNQ